MNKNLKKQITLRKKLDQLTKETNTLEAQIEELDETLCKDFDTTEGLVTVAHTEEGIEFTAECAIFTISPKNMKKVMEFINEQ